MFLIMISLTLTGQGITDTIFHIDGVSITAGQIFVKERAGMKVTDVDTTHLLLVRVAVVVVDDDCPAA